MKSLFQLSQPVAKALEEKRPVVALESTIITHGMPYPDNLETAQDMSRIVTSHGAVPAVICLMDGVIKIGLEDTELHRLSEEANPVKCSVRDLPVVLQRKQSGGTTVAATMFIADQVGIRFFATGGIGGVHRFGHETFDISNDLIQLTRSNVCVVSSGAKSILDLAATMEYLETQGVLVVGYKTTSFPAFFSATSKIKLDYKADSVEELVQILRIKEELGLTGGMLVANPIPAEFAIETAVVENCLADALANLEMDGVRGKDVTPYLLQKLLEATGSQTLVSNKALAKNNADLAAKMSVSLLR